MPSLLFRSAVLFETVLSSERGPTYMPMLPFPEAVLFTTVLSLVPQRSGESTIGLSGSPPCGRKHP